MKIRKYKGRWRLMGEAPRDREIVAFNDYVGEYRTRYRDGLWPMMRWNGVDGTWYPVPSKWREKEHGGTSNS